MRCGNGEKISVDFKEVRILIKSWASVAGIGERYKAPVGGDSEGNFWKGREGL